MKKYSNYIFREDTIMIQDVPLVSRVKVPVTTNTKNSDSFYVKTEIIFHVYYAD